MRSTTNSVRPILWAFALSLILILPVLNGCTIRTQNGNLNILNNRTKPTQKPAVEPKEQTQPATEDFTDLSKDEQETLADKSRVLPEPEPEKEPVSEPVVSQDDPASSFPTRLTNNPKGILALQNKLFIVPASAEIVLFDPETRHREKRKAALELTDQGRQAMDAGNIELAISKFQKAISVDSKIGHPYFYFARARFIQQDWDQVVALSDKASLLLTEETVFLSRALFMKAQALANQKNYIPALAACESAIDADSTNVQAKLLRKRIKALY